MPQRCGRSDPTGLVNGRQPVAWVLHALALGSTVTQCVATHLPRETAAEILFELGWAGLNELIHFGVYATSGMLWCLAFWSSASPAKSRRVRLRVLGFMSLLAILDEATQPFVGRSAEVIDVIADILGVLVGLVIARPVWAVLQHSLSRLQAAPSTVRGSQELKA
jgi:hypothetical protein